MIRIALAITCVAVAAAAQAQGNTGRNAYFGQTHSHTSWSLDAYIIGNHVTGPAEAYQYSMGQPIKHPAGFEVKLKRPLDFHGVTDHSEYVGMVRLANDPTSQVSKLPVAEKLKVRKPEDVVNIFKWLAGSLAKSEPIKDLLDPKVAGTVWQENIAIADKYNRPGKFTTFVAYEWTSAPNSRNMHRNVFFRDSKKVPALPFTSIDSAYPNDLWNWMDAQRKAGIDLLAISHNANLSDGIMFPTEKDHMGRAIDAAWARQRMENEPLTEIVQIKGASETHPALSPNDEFAGYEIMSFLLGTDNSTSRANGSYVREGWQNGLALQQARGFNPYRMGVVGASDSHNTVISYTNATFFGQHGAIDASPKLRMQAKVEAGMAVVKTGTSGLAGVWAEENTRDALFRAMQRREVFATSGVRIKVRMFGGWDFTPAVLKQKDWPAAGYALGTPMGGDLPAPKAKAPSFIVQAIKDPDEANLDRVQIIKGWTKNGQIFEKIYDVAWSGKRKRDKDGRVGSVGSTVDIKNASYTNTIGAIELKAVWTDPDFDPSLDAFYYVRVLQIPTPRWSTYDAKQVGVAPPAEVPATVQERAWSSPIWYTPAAAARQGAARGTTVSELTQRGATALDDAQLKQLVVGQTVEVRNTVTGQKYEIVYGTDGRRVITARDGKAGAQQGDLLAMSELGLTGQAANYEIRGNRIVTVLGGTPFEVAVYRVGDKYVAARTSEFGYANYEVSVLK
jgi:hypothetical protein